MNAAESRQSRGDGRHGPRGLPAANSNTRRDGGMEDRPTGAARPTDRADGAADGAENTTRPIRRIAVVRAADGTASFR